MSATDALAYNTPNGSGEMIQRRNLARQAGVMAAAGEPGFESYLEPPKAEVSRTSAGHTVDPSVSHVAYEDDDFSLSDLGDLLNPLQHLPLIGTLYREITGDTDVKPYIQTAGDLLYGGALGAVGGLLAAGGMVLGAVLTTSAAVGNAAVGEVSGQTADTQLATALFGGNEPVRVAAASVAPPSVPTMRPKSSQPAEAVQTAAAAPLLPARVPTPAMSQDEMKAKIAEGVKQAGDMEMNPYKQIAGLPPSQRLAVLAQTDNMYIGKNLYKKTSGNRAITTAAPPKTLQTMRADAGIAPAVPAAPVAVKPEVESLTPVAETQVPVRAAAATVPAVDIEAAKADKERFGQIIFDSGRKAQLAEKTGVKNALPPALVQDMMLMALDKYESAYNLGGSTSKAN